jgi:hypothetical protein
MTQITADTIPTKILFVGVPPPVTSTKLFPTTRITKTTIARVLFSSLLRVISAKALLYLPRFWDSRLTPSRRSASLAIA